MREVAIVGGGPAGSTAATILAAAGRDVVVFEKEKFPRFHVGESLLPHNMRIFERLGVVDKLASSFMHKWGVEFLSSGGRHRSLFHFDEALDPRYPMSFQVRRAEFDAILLDRARESGAEVRQGAGVVEAAAAAGGGWRLAVEEDGGRKEVRARFLIDAGGRDGILARKVGLRKMDSGLKKASLYAQYTGVPRGPGRDEGNLVLVLLEDGWFWFIPLAGGVTSVGLVTDGERLRRVKLPASEALAEAIASCPAASELMRDAVKVSETWAASDWAFACRRLAGDDFLIAGDAAVFVDPIFSSGVLLAMRSGEMAADHLAEALRANDLSRRRFRRYERDVLRHARAYYRMVICFYNSGFARMSFGAAGRNGIYRAVLNFLAGDMSPAWPIKWRIEVFYLLAGIARRFNLGPEMDLHRTFEPHAAGAAGGAMRAAI